MTGGDLCARGLHPAPAEGPCPACAGVTLCARRLHDVSAEGSTYQGRDGRTRCLECRRARQRRARQKARRRRAEEARGPVEPADERPPLVAAVPAWVGREAAARHRHALMVRRQRGLLP